MPEGTSAHGFPVPSRAYCVAVNPAGRAARDATRRETDRVAKRCMQAELDELA